MIEIAPRILARVCDEETGRHHPRASPRARRRHPPRRRRDRRCGACRTARLTVETSDRRNARGRPDRGRHRRRARRRAGESRRARRAGRHRGRRPRPHLRSRDLRRRRLHPLSRARTGRCGWRTGATRRSTAPSPAAMPPAATSPTTSRRRSGRSNSTCTSRASAGRSRRPARACAGRWPASATLLFELDGAHIAYALGINAQRDHRHGAPPDRAQSAGRCRRARGRGQTACGDAEGEGVEHRQIATGVPPPALSYAASHPLGEHARSNAQKMDYAMTAPLKTVESTTDVAGLMHDIGRRAKAAARVLALAGTAQKDDALTAMAAAIRAHKAAILAANAAGPGRGQGVRHDAGIPRPAGARRQARRGHGRRPRRGARARRSRRRGDGALDAAERHDHRARAGAARRRRHHLREPART